MPVHFCVSKQYSAHNNLSMTLWNHNTSAFCCQLVVWVNRERLAYSHAHTHSDNSHLFPPAPAPYTHTLKKTQVVLHGQTIRIKFTVILRIMSLKNGLGSLKQMPNVLTSVLLKLSGNTKIRATRFCFCPSTLKRAHILNKMEEIMHQDFCRDQNMKEDWFHQALNTWIWKRT